MGKTIDPSLMEALREESERTREAAYPDVKPTRPNRSRVCSIRLSDDEQERIEQAAQARNLPVSTLVRAWLLERLDKEQPA